MSSAHPISMADIQVKTAYGLSATEWQALTEQERRDHRANVANAPNFNQGGQA